MPPVRTSRNSTSAMRAAVSSDVKPIFRTVTGIEFEPPAVKVSPVCTPRLGMPAAAQQASRIQKDRRKASLACMDCEDTEVPELGEHRAVRPDSC